MCVVSMVSDHYQPLITPWVKKISPQPIIDHQDISEIDLIQLSQLLKEFNDAMKAAKKVDVLTKQPDCVAPEKAELNKRIEALELEVKKLRRAQNKKQKKSPIK